jgi:hypothetical protein
VSNKLKTEAADFLRWARAFSNPRYLKIVNSEMFQRAWRWIFTIDPECRELECIRCDLDLN